LAWKIEFEQKAQKELAKLTPEIADRILSFLEERVVDRGDPRMIGSALQGAKLGNLWRYRVGDYRVVCDIQDKVLTVLVVKVGKRGSIYKGK